MKKNGLQIRKKGYTLLITRKKNRLGYAFGIALALGLSACFAPQTDAASQTEAALTEITPMPVIAMEAGASLQEGEAALPGPTSLAPLRFSIPTPGAEPISDWRPPLYPVPWAIAPHDHFYFIRPINANEINWPLSSYRYGGIFFGDVVHTGIDIPTGAGTPIVAAGSGTVAWADWGFFSGSRENKKDPYGQAVVIEHNFGYQGKKLYTVYAHMSRIDVTEGQWVQAGEQLGLVGDTGHTTGPHLHFEIRLAEDSFYDTYNPELWIAPPQGWGVLVGSVANERGEQLRHYQVQLHAYDSGRMRTVRTYGANVVNSDDYYQENMVLSDLPAGWYEIQIVYEEKILRKQIQIFPGQVSYFTFAGLDGYSLELPAAEAWKP